MNGAPGLQCSGTWRCEDVWDWLSGGLRRLVLRRTTLVELEPEDLRGSDRMGSG